MFRRVVGHLVLALSLVGGAAFASGQEPVPPKQLEPRPAEKAELVRVPVEEAFQDAAPETEEEPDKEGMLPDVPILFEGKVYSAEELGREGIHLSHVALDNYSAESRLALGFRTGEELRKYLEQTGQMPSDEPADQKAALACGPYHSYFFEHAWYGGNYFAVPPGYGHANLWWWNDRISSVWASGCARWTLLTEHSYFGGQHLWVARGWALNNLSNYGWWTWHWWWGWRWYSWNDRASSVAVFW
jgi:hypothetical protein